MTVQSACPGDNGYCLPTFSLCNGVKDCPNGTDEDASFCSSYNCSSAGLVRCPALQWHGLTSLKQSRLGMHSVARTPLGCTHTPRYTHTPRMHAHP